MTDNYEFNHSMHRQSDNEYSPYNDKQWNNYVDVINGAVYQSSGLSLVQFDLSSIYNSGAMTDTNDLFVVIPIIMAAAFINIAKHFQLMSEMSIADLNQVAYTLGVTKPDNWKSKFIMLNLEAL